MISSEEKDNVIIESVKEVAKQVIEECGYDEFIENYHDEDDEDFEMGFCPDAFIEELMCDQNNLDMIFETIYNDPAFAEREWENCFRSRDELKEYMDEALDKVWLMRNCYIAVKEPVYEAGRPAMERILNSYDDIPEEGYSDWECGYWNGILGALRWVLGEEKDFLDS